MTIDKFQLANLIDEDLNNYLESHFGPDFGLTITPDGMGVAMREFKEEQRKLLADAFLQGVQSALRHVTTNKDFGH